MQYIFINGHRILVHILIKRIVHSRLSRERLNTPYLCIVEIVIFHVNKKSMYCYIIRVDDHQCKILRVCTAGIPGYFRLESHLPGFVVEGL